MRRSWGAESLQNVVGNRCWSVRKRGKIDGIQRFGGTWSSTMIRVLFVVSEYFPYIKTGGLADATSALAAALRHAGVDVQVMLPNYAGIDINRASPKQILKIPPLPGIDGIKLIHQVDKNSGVPLWLVDCPEVYDFEGGIYDEPAPGAGFENARRFGTLSWAATQLATSRLVRWRPDIVHLHDWHAALASLYLGQHSERGPASVLTIHNLAFQGCFPLEAAEDLGITPDDLTLQKEGKRDCLSFLGEAIAGCTKITTVSPNYAKEIMQPEFGCGFDDLLTRRQRDVVGILNGVDYQTWCPELDPHLPLQGSQFDEAARLRCRNELQSRLGLKVTQKAPILAFTNRLTEQKMVDVILDALPAILEREVQLVFHGKGEERFAAPLMALAEQFPKQLAVRIGHSQSLEHLIHAGSDICLSPSRFEPCGLNPLYAMRYGAIPVARAVGGIVDSLVDTDKRSLENGTANGFIFEGTESTDLITAIDRALHHYREPSTWRKIRANGNRRQFKWQHAAQHYINVYKSILEPAGLAGMDNTMSGKKLAENEAPQSRDGLAIA